VAATGEFVGTFLFLLMGFAGAQVANSQANPPAATGSNPSLILYIALSFGFSLVVNVWIFYRVSGGMFNPAVTFALVLAGAVPIPRAILCVVSQILGGMSAAGVVQAMLPGDLIVNTSLGGGCTIVQGLFIEMFLTAQLIITILMLAVEKTKATYLAPVGIGMALFIAHLAGVYYTGASLNPARSFGPAVATKQFDEYHWIYWVGPLLGAVVATGFYEFLKILGYEAANPDQDIDLSYSVKTGHCAACCADRSAAMEDKGLSHTCINVSDNESGSPVQSRSPVPAAAVFSTPSGDRVLPTHT